MNKAAPGLNKPFDVTEHVQTGDSGHMSASDMKEHVKTWHGFLSFIKWQLLGIVIIMILLAIFRTNT